MPTRKLLLRAFLALALTHWVTSYTRCMAARWSSVVKCVNTVRLTWNGATSTNVDVYRNGVVIATTPNDGLYVDSTGDTGQQHLAQNRRQLFIRTTKRFPPSLRLWLELFAQ